MKIKLVEPIKDCEDNFKYYHAENERGVKSWTHEGNEVYYVKELDENSEKYQKLMKLLKRDPCHFFISLGEKIKYFLSKTDYKTSSPGTLKDDLYIMTDFTDPRPLYGLSITVDDGWTKKEDLYYLAFYTDWENIDDGWTKKRRPILSGLLY